MLRRVSRRPRPRRRRVHHGQLRHDQRRADLPRVRLDLRHDRERCEPATASSGTSVPCAPVVRNCRAAAGSAAATTAGGTPPSHRQGASIALGGTFVLLNHDLWGADGASISRYPGDNGSWTDYDNYLNRLFNDVRTAGITVQWDIWNEPNISLFWNRPQSQYFELWRRTYQRIRATFPTMLIVGPSCACVPSTGGWWTIPGLREGQQRRPRHRQLALVARRSGVQRRHGELHAGLTGHRPPPAVPDQRGTARPTSRTPAAGRGTSPGLSGPARTACARTGPAARTCTTIWPAC